MLYSKAVRFYFLFLIFFPVQIIYSCEDNGTWAEILASPSSDKPTYILGGVFSIHQSNTDSDSDDDTVISLRCDCTYQETVFLAEAMIYAIDQINKRPDLLPGVDLGYNILGSCDIASENAYFALEEYSLLEMQILNMTDDSAENSHIGDDFIERPVTAIIGPCSSDGSTSMANILHSYGIPIISYGATVTELSKRSRFPTLFRTVFSDDKQVEALADLSRTFNWTYIAAVGSDDDLGHEGVESFKRIITSKGMCLSSESYFDADGGGAHLIEIIDNLKRKTVEGCSLVTVVLLFMEWEYARMFLQQANSQQLANITWLGVDHWASDVGMTLLMPDDYLPAPFTKGTIATQFASASVRPFVDYMTNYKNLVKRMRKNKWLMHFYCDTCKPDGRNFTCTIEFASSYNCSKAVDLSAILARQRRIPNVISGVYSAAYALDNVIKLKDHQLVRQRRSQKIADHLKMAKYHSGQMRNFGKDHQVHAEPKIIQAVNRLSIIQNLTHNHLFSTNRTTANLMTRPDIVPMTVPDYEHLVRFLSTVNFSYSIGSYRSPRISFRSDGDLNDASFEIVNFYQYDHAECYMPARAQRVGIWTEEEDEDGQNQTTSGNLILHTEKIKWQTDFGTAGPPMSYCHRACVPGERLVPGPTSCCWSCEICPPSFYTDTYNSHECKPCALHTYSNQNGTACLPNARVWIGYSDLGAILCICLCCLGEILTLIAAIICCAANRHGPNHDDDGYAMKTVVFINFALAYSYVGVIFAQPTVQTCTIRLVMWESLAAANLVAKFFMLPQGRKAAAKLAKMLGLVKPQPEPIHGNRSRRQTTDSISTPSSTRPRLTTDSGSGSSGSRSASVTRSRLTTEDSCISSPSTSVAAFAQRWICEICYAVVMTVAIAAFIISGTLVPTTVLEEDLVQDQEQPTQTMLSCGPNYILTGVFVLILCALWVFNLVTSSSMYRRARRRRRSAFGGSTLTASGQSIAKRTAVEFHASNLLWSGYLTVLVLIVVVPLYVTTDDPWSRALFQIYVPFVLITLLAGVFAVPRCWHALKTVYCTSGAGADDVFEPSSPYVISSSTDLQPRKMSTIHEVETTEL